MNNNLCPYKNLFGEENTGVHSYRIFDIAIVDFTLTIICAYLIAKFINKDFKIVLLILFILGIILHRLFCVRTTVDKLLFY